MKFAMKPAGWRYDSYRHSLAAKGISTGRSQGYFSRKYMATQYSSFADELGLGSSESVNETLEKMREESEDKWEYGRRGVRSPSTVQKELLANRQLSAIAEEDVVSKRKFSKVLRSIEAGQFDKVTVEDETGRLVDKPFDEVLTSLSPNEYKSAVSQIRRRVTELAKAGVITSVNDVPPSIKEYVQTDPATVSLITGYNQDRKDVQRSSFLGRAGNTAGTLAVSAVAGTEVLGRAAARGVQGAYGELQAAGPGFYGNPDLQVEGPGVKNVFFEGYRPGKFSPAGSLPDKREVQRLLGSEGGLFTKEALTPNQYVQKEIDELFAARKTLAKADLEAYDRGVKAFEEGNREELLNAITDLESQEQTLSDRWMLAEQSRAQVMNPTNRALAYAEENDSMFGGLFGQNESGGGKVLADRTKKINDVKKMLKNSSNELFARRKLLRYKLQRMDSVVPPATDAPRRVQVLKEHQPVADWLTVPPQTSPRGVLQDVFATKMPSEDLSQNAPPGV